MTDTNVETRARATDPDTSHDAVPEPVRMAHQQARVLLALYDVCLRHGSVSPTVLVGATVSEVARRMSLDGSNRPVPQRNIIGRRITDLAELGLVRDTGQRRMADTGRRQIVWHDTPAGTERVSRLRS